jgi:hypothetical protein
MNGKRARSSVAALASLAVVGFLFLGAQSEPESTSAGDLPKPGQPVVMPANLIGLRIYLGLKDAAATDWDGEVSISAGKIVGVDIVQGNPKALAKDNQFSIRSVFIPKKLEKKKDEIVRPIIRVTLDAPSTTRVKMVTKQGTFEFVVDDVPAGSAKTFLEDAAKVERDVGALRIAGTENEEDYPVLARAANSTYWLAYCEYKKGTPYVAERVLAGNFEDLVPKGNGDQLKLKSFDGKTWGPAFDVTDAGLDIWRPAITVDGKGLIHLAWAQQVDGNWDIYHRTYNPAAKSGGLSAITRLTTQQGTDFNVVAATDSRGDVWLAWQSRQPSGRFEIHAARINADGGARSATLTVSRPREAAKARSGNCWSPAIAADSRGNVYVAYDNYDLENYDVLLAIIKGGQLAEPIEVAASPHFEARPNLVVDGRDRVWIAYEEGDEQWGKDYATDVYKKIGLSYNPGNGLYQRRTVKVKCLADGKLSKPAGDLQKALATQTANNRSMPRVAVDTAGGIWLLYRHHPRPLGNGEVWNSFATRYDGKAWSTPRRLDHSDNLMDNRPAAAAFGPGILVVGSSDARPNQLNRKQNDLYAAVLPAQGEVHPMDLVADAPPINAELKTRLKPVHPNEAEEVARMRAYRIDYQGKKLRLWRGEFHRHTEYTAHRDQDGLLEDSWRYAIDAGNLDWMGNADHDNGHHDEYSWWQIQKMTDLMQASPHFTAVHSYERSVVYPNGHRNVIFPKRGIRPMPRGVLKGTEELGTPDTKTLYRYLKHFGGICSSHTSATTMGTDWRDNDPVYEPVVEIYQGHRHNYEHFGAPRSPTKETQIGGYEPKGFVNLALDKGYKLGFQSSSDHVSTHMSYAVVLTDDISRQGIIDAFKRRHSYAATDNIIVEFRSGKQMMGDIFDTNQLPAFEVIVHGTAPVQKISLIRSGKYIHIEEPKKQEVRLSFTDREAEAGKTNYYYVRVEQSDGNLAWASPMWITYRR